uniref:HECT domain-containing protein n=1 Tax=Leishmania guyanensis TaxID=5670 RepID=A0A1E1J654_LEIGU|nr:hypothetical protein, conserved [Leishmania guyanensis]
MDIGIHDSKAQVRAVVAEWKAMNFIGLFEAIDVMSISLVMGFERYLRKFDSAAAIPILVDVCKTFIKENTQGDLIVVSLRALSLIMEHVPSSYEAAQSFHVSLVELSSQAIHRALRTEWTFVQSNNNAMIEEGLRVMRFISKDDMTGELIHRVPLGDLLTLCTDSRPLVARQALETLLMMSCKVVMPSELESPSRSFASNIFSVSKWKKLLRSGTDGGKLGRKFFFNRGSSTKATATEGTVPYADHPVVAQVENVISPLLVSLVEQYAKSLVSIPEHWILLELSLQCLGTLIERALICHRPHTARALTSPLLPKILFQLILDTESNVTLEPSVRIDRVLLCETTLTLLTSCHRYLMLESLQLPEARRFFQLILEDATDEITTLLDDPFPRAVIATRSTQNRDKDHITSIAALQLFVLACPTVPSDAFGLKPKLVLPVHQWMWEDEMRHKNCMIEEQCVLLERSWARLDHHACIPLRLKSANVDLRTMTMWKGPNGVHRNIFRAYIPFVYHFADEAALRPIVAVKEAGPCAADGTMLVWKLTTSETHDRHAMASTIITKEVNSDTGSSSSTRRGRFKGSITSRTLSEKESTNASASVLPAVVLNTQLEVPEDHISLTEEYFTSLCIFAKNTSGQMAKQVATCACASMLQLMFLSGASERFEKLMTKAVLPMCEMCREALISADKATKALALTMIGWMLYHPMAEPCEFTGSALRCGLLAQLEILSKMALLVHERPTRTATLAEKANTLAGCIVEKIKNSRTSHIDGDAEVNVASNTTLDRAFFSAAMLRVQTVLDELQRCQCKAAKDPVATSSSSTTTTADKQGSSACVSKVELDTHESAIRELLRIFQESNDITAYEVFNAGVASTLLYYLLGDRTLEDVAGDTVVYASGAAASTFQSKTVSLQGVHMGLIDRNASSWAAMMASGMHVADILAMYMDEKRMQCFIQCAVAYPTGMRRLVSTLTSNLSLQSYLPLVESVVTYNKVVCKTPLQAHDALVMISPLITLCGDAGQRILAAIKNTTDDILPLPHSDNSVTADGFSSMPAASHPSRAEPKLRKPGLLSSSLALSKAILSRRNEPRNVTRIAKECCMEGHRLQFTESYRQAHFCNKCHRTIFSGHHCRTCNYNVCVNCHRGYTGNVELIRSLASIERNHVHLCATIGDLERWFRTGSTSTKGTQLAPASQSTLNHLERFTTRVLTFLKRYTEVRNTPAATPFTHASGATAPSFLSSASPTTSISFSVELAKKLLSHPNVVRRLTYKYLSQFSMRGVLLDEGAPIIPAHATALDAEVQKVLSTAVERQAAHYMVQEAVEERYILYRPSCGMLPFHETVLSTLYRRAFALGDYQLLLKLENCLLRLDGTVEEPLTLQANSAVTVANPAAVSSGRHLNMKFIKKSKSVKSPLAGGRTWSFSSSASITAGKPITASEEKLVEERELEGNSAVKNKTYIFHHFESDSAACCACGAHSRAEFHTEEPPALIFTAPDFAHRADMLLLIMLHRVLFEETHGLIAYAAEAKAIFGGDDSIFENSAITTALVRSLEASALRVSMLPPLYALPRWVNFVLREGRFLIPLSVRERTSRFLAYGARRSFTQHMRFFRNQRTNRPFLNLPGEWARQSNHKFSVSRDTFARDAYMMLRKCSDARFPISVEFKGDVGVGQGPTAQFYTLLATEVSKCCTKLWRVDGDKASNRTNTAAVTNSSLAVVARTDSLMAASPPTSLPRRTSSITPTHSPARASSIKNGAAGTVNSRSFGATYTPTSSAKISHAGSVDSAACSATLSPRPFMAGALDADAVLVPPPEGFYPRHMDGVRWYVEDVESFPTTPLRCCSSDRFLGDSVTARALHRSCSEQLGFSMTRRGLSFIDHASTWGTDKNHHHSNNLSASAAHHNVNKRTVLVDRNAGLMRGYAMEQRERAKAYYAIGAALGRVFVDEQVFPLSLSRAIVYFIRRGVPAYQSVLPIVKHTDPLPEFPIDLFELPLAAVSWADQRLAKSLASLSTMDKATLAALDLYFTLPGDDNFELFPGGAQVKVTKENLRLYQRRVVGAFLYESVAVPLYFLTMGFQDVVPHEALTALEVEELIGILCGEDKNPNDPLWTTDEIRSVLVGDHGYQNDSPQLGLLAKVLGQRLTPAEQRDFLLFCTGCPRLPIGGIRALGAITVVRSSNAFAEAHTEALQAEAGTSVGSSSGGAGLIHVEEGEEGEEGEVQSGPLGGLCKPSAQTNAEDTPSVQPESPRCNASSLYSTVSEQPCDMTSTFEADLADSEWALPSVNTCFRYLKLPPYPSEDLLYKKLLLSITQSGGNFELS